LTKRELSFFEQELEALLEHKNFKLNLSGSNFPKICKEMTYMFKRLMSRYLLIDSDNKVVMLKEDLETCIGSLETSHRYEVSEVQGAKVVSFDIDSVLRCPSSSSSSSFFFDALPLLQLTLLMEDPIEGVIEGVKIRNMLSHRIDKFKKFLKCIGKGVARYSYISHRKNVGGMIG